MLQAYRSEQIYDVEAAPLREGVPLMARAAAGIAKIITNEVRPGTPISLFVGAGNNGADALYAAEGLKGYPVTVYLTSGRADVGALAAAQNAGAQVSDDLPDAARSPVWVDAISGIGLTGPLRPPLASVVEELAKTAAATSPLVFAVDLPTGVNADDGTVGESAIPATHTITFGAYKPAQFLPPGAHLCGKLHLVDIGLTEEFAAQTPAVSRLQEPDLARAWPIPGAHDHKYTRGVVGLLTGSAQYPGAAVLSAGGALHMGPGMIRFYGLGATPAVRAHPEIVPHPDIGQGRVDAWVLGSGISGKSSEQSPAVHSAIARAHAEGVPMVLDAGALEWVETGSRFGATDVLTPHAGELAALLTRLGEPTTREQVEHTPTVYARKTQQVTGAVVVLKGATTLIAGPGELYSNHHGVGWMASAGSGDVLAGILGTVCAQWHASGHHWRSFTQAVAGGVMLHGMGGEKASLGGPLLAHEIAHGARAALRKILAQ